MVLGRKLLFPSFKDARTATETLRDVPHVDCPRDTIPVGVESGVATVGRLEYFQTAE